jgi:chorismate mutase
VRAIRGAITVESNTEEAIRQATQELLRELAQRNGLAAGDVISAFFTLTPDLNAAFPARAARGMGWDMPMLDMIEIDVPGALQRCVRVLLHVDGGQDVSHVYLRGARDLRPDLEIP